MAILWAAWHSEGEPRPLGAQPLPQLLEQAASRVADSTASDHPGMAADEDFLQPIELLLPHAFHPTDGQESVVMLGARQGATEWLPLPIGSVKDIGGPDEEGIAHLKVASP